jgi:hypothetical protein
MINNPVKPEKFNKLSVGAKRYNGGPNGPNFGTSLDPAGFKERDLKLKTRNNAVLRRLKANSQNKYMSVDSLNPGNTPL